MSIAVENFTDNFADKYTSQPPKKKTQTPYKPRLSTVVKRAMEDCVQDALEAQRTMEQMLQWLEHETRRHQDIRQRIAALPTPLDHRMATLQAEEGEALIRMGELQLYLARMALTVTRLERRLEASLARARDGTPPPDERKRIAEAEMNGSGKRQQ